MGWLFGICIKDIFCDVSTQECLEKKYKFREHCAEYYEILKLEIKSEFNTYMHWC